MKAKNSCDSVAVASSTRKNPFDQMPKRHPLIKILLNRKPSYSLKELEILREDQRRRREWIMSLPCKETVSQISSIDSEEIGVFLALANLMQDFWQPYEDSLSNDFGFAVGHAIGQASICYQEARRGPEDRNKKIRGVLSPLLALAKAIAGRDKERVGRAAHGWIRIAEILLGYLENEQGLPSNYLFSRDFPSEGFAWPILPDGSCEGETGHAAEEAEHS